VITHTDIIQRFQALRLEALNLATRHALERQTLRELCGGIGHKFGELYWHTSVSFGTAAPVIPDYEVHRCEICGQVEKV
jgi:hypothetical protein